MKAQSPNTIHPPSHLPRILVIDDEPTFTRLMKLNLEATAKYVVAVENDPSQALRTALSFRPDLVLLDVMMPNLDGGDIANLFRTDKILRNVPVIFLTATVKHVEVNANQGCIGGLQFLPKPVVLAELLEFLGEHFRKQSAPVRLHS